MPEGHQNNKLAWFWSMDIPKDTERSNWMSECTSHKFCLMLEPQLKLQSSLSDTLAMG
ncbi:hypothetical protein L210DRAFT_3416879 [Boletus edulis BED1]|uniref:Uncharacterized protein n=1 Tax=Boletus edulis BED1 TaxID=1328754 RepID=A0AAD4G991_BOLED|nr:hypothetical protein L210DRAFT_3416879 [Boletus edulis BED1]